MHRVSRGPPVALAAQRSTCSTLTHDLEKAAFSTMLLSPTWVQEQRRNRDGQHPVWAAQPVQTELSELGSSLPRSNINRALALRLVSFLSTGTSATNLAALLRRNIPP